LNFKLWSRQIDAIIRLELKKYVFARRWLGVYLLALAPIFLFGVNASLVNKRGLPETIYAGFFQLYFLRFAIFFGCFQMFTQLFRGEILEKTLHYYLLAPVRREVLAAGKFLAGLIAGTAVFAGSTVATYILASASAGLGDNGLQHLARYIAVVMLACLGYGAVFMLTALLFKNPKGPAMLLLGWEWLNFFLPEFLQKFSIVHYLQSICPVPVSRGPLAVLTAPTSAWYSVPGLLILTAMILVVTGFMIRRVEITYSAD
jgi:ABC-type transport system involved in multi-copper enzyme maturation permease subunit